MSNCVRRLSAARLREMIYEAVIRNLNTEGLIQLMQKLEAYAPEDFSSMTPQELWQVLVDLSVINANAYKGAGVKTTEQRALNERIYGLKNHILEGIVPVLNASRYFKVNLDGDLLMVRNADGRQVTFHVKGIDSLGGIEYSDPEQTWDAVEKAYLYDDPQEYEYAKSVFQKYRPLKWWVVKTYTDYIKRAALQVFSDESVYDYLKIWDSPEKVKEVISQMEPFVSNNPALHTDISLKSLFGRQRINMGNPQLFGEVADDIARKMGYNSAAEVNDEITKKLTEIAEEIKGLLFAYKQDRTMVGESRTVRLDEGDIAAMVRESVRRIIQGPGE